MPSSAHTARGFVAWAYGLSWPPLALLVLDNRDVLSLPGWLSAMCGIGATLGPGIAALLVARDRTPLSPRGLWARSISSFDRHAGWYLFAATGPVVLLVIAGGLYITFTGPLPTPDIGPSLVFYGALLYVEAFGEELGWRGFLLPQLRQTHTPVIASLIVGTVWALWHLPLFLTSGNVISHVPFPSYALLVVAGSFAFTWLHERTDSVALAAVMHGALNTAATPFLLDADPSAIAGLFTWFAVVVVAAGAVLAATGLTSGTDLAGPRSVLETDRMDIEVGYIPERVVTTVAELESILGEQFDTQVKKVIDHIDEHCRSWIERSPFVIVSSAAGSGAIDVSPKGDPPGFVRVLDPKTLAVPDRPGNHRGDTFRNVLENPEVGLMFVVPKRREVVRISGVASIVRDPLLLESMAVADKVPTLALLVRVREAMFHCGKSMIRSHMWEPELWGPVDGLPTYAQALVDHGALDTPLADVEWIVDFNEQCRLYDD